MWNEILNDLWRVYRGRLLGSVFGLFIGAMFLILGFLQTIFLLICISESAELCTDCFKRHFKFAGRN